MWKSCKNYSRSARAQSQEENMAEKRGRPKTHGAQPGWMLVRIMALVDQYNAGREAGLKESEALRRAVVSIREQFPDMPISEGAARRILAEWQSKNKMS